jgi:uncharacterized protein (DUF1697 family)
MTYIALLRGINVSGQNMIKMPDLAALLLSEGFVNVKTYLQSGNVVFEFENTPQQLENIIRGAIQKKFNYEVPVLVLTADEFIRVYHNNPFLKDSSLDIEKMHITFLSHSQKGKDLSAIQIPHADNEKLFIADREVYLYCPNGYGTSKLNNNAFERKLKTTATTRNWKTMSALLSMIAEK